jgi:hypothetical protein
MLRTSANCSIPYAFEKVGFYQDSFFAHGSFLHEQSKHKNMKTQKTINAFSKGFILLSAASLLSVSLMAFSNPQSVMNLVQVQLTNTDALSSIRGVYGGVGLTLVISLVYLMLKDVQNGLAFLCLLWGLYAVSRIITAFADGALGAFGSRWLLIESSFFCIAALLFVLRKRHSASKPPYVITPDQPVPVA